jgi:hypothetical protein
MSVDSLPSNVQLPTCACSGCQRQFEARDQIYRCYDCRFPFHRDCLPLHANDWKYLHPLPDTLKRGRPSAESVCYCHCDDGDPRACHGWHGQQDEPPCACICHEELPAAYIERLTGFIEKWTQLGHLQTFAGRLRFRTEAFAVLGTAGEENDGLSNSADPQRMIDEEPQGKPTGTCLGTTRGNLGANSPALRLLPSAWMKVHALPSTVDQPPGELEIECYAGDDPPDDQPGWIPLYRRLVAETISSTSTKGD